MLAKGLDVKLVRTQDSWAGGSNSFVFLESQEAMSRQILVIDDDQSMCELIQDSLQRNGWEVTWRLRGDEGLELVREQAFDVVITDVNLEQMSGLDLCRNLTENRPDTPVIVITAYGNMSSAIAAIRAGAYDFINKPIDMAQLAHVIDRPRSIATCVRK